MWKVNDDGQRKIAMVHLNGKKEKHKKKTNTLNNPPQPPRNNTDIEQTFFYLIKLKEKHW